MKRSFALAAVLLFFWAALIHAQGLGTIVGTITDPSLAIVPSAKVTVSEVGTSLARSVTSDQQGYYVIPSLRPADYNLIVEASGFRRFSQKGITLLADQSVTVNVSLQLGASSQTVTVEATPTQVNTTTATLGQVIELARVADLPLNGRNAAQLTLGVPGAVSSPGGGADQGATKTIPGAVTISTNGSRQNQVSYMLDGGNNVDEYTTVNQPFPFPDALQEFSVQTSNYSAQYGENAGAVVNVVTKSGSNNFHGDLFEFNRIRSYNARNFFAPERDPLKRNQFGGTVGGPIFKGRTFFFAGYQGTRQRTATLQSTTIPTAAQITSVGTAIDPASSKLLSFLPPTSDPRGNVSYFRPDNQNFNEVVGKVDHSFRQKDQLSFRWYYDRFQRQGVFDSKNILNYLDAATIPSQNYLLHETHTFGSSLLNDFRFSYSREAAQRGPVDGTLSVRDLGVTIPFQPARNAIQTVNVSGAFNFGDNPDATFIRNNFTWSDDVSWVRGRHDLRIGGTVERSRVDLDNLFQQPGEFRFNSSPPASPGGVFDNFLRGTLGGNPGFRQGAGEFKNNRNTFAGLYVQDMFRVSRRLTLNGGLRWEPSLPWREIKGRVEQFRLSDFLAGKKSTAFSNAPPGLFFPGDAGFPANGQAGSLNLFAPRLGFAYDVFGDGKTSLRGGAGIFYDSRTPGIFNNRFVDVTPFSTQLTFSSPPGPFSDPLCQRTSGCTAVSNPFPTGFPPPSNVAFPLPVLAVTYDPATRYLAPTMYNWNLAIEREVSPGWLVRAAYAGSHTSRIREQVELNPAKAGSIVTTGISNVDQRRTLNSGFPACSDPITGKASNCPFGSVALDSHDVNASYHALQLSLERRASRGVTILAHYTYSKSIDDLPYVIGGSGVADLGAGDALSPAPWFDPTRHQWDRGPSDFDHAQRLAFSYVAPLPGFTASSSLLRAALGGWKLSGLVQAQTGRPLTPMSGFGSGSDRSQTGLGRDRAVFLGGNAYFDGTVDPCAGSTAICVPYLNKSAFTQPAVGTFGNAGKGSLRFPGLFTWDMGFLKDFKVTERMSVQFRAEFFNIFNRVNFRDDDGNADNTARANNTNFGALKSANDPRIGQLALKIVF